MRELENCVKRALALAPADETLTAMILEPLLRGGSSESAETSPSLKARLLEAERVELIQALDDAAGNKSRAASRLGVSRKTLYARMRRLGLEVD